ncbi:MAG: relaxase MobL [Eubacterium sp.]|nr:relaxase MobL [Eubacterium sp.]
MHEGNVWTHVVSLRREDAERMGYNNLPAWRDLVRRHIDDIAAAQKIDRKNLKWYAAFHDKENNPHVHIVVYSQNPKEGFLTNDGIEKIRSVFANDIYRDELQNLYQKQTAIRDKLRAESDNLMKSLVSELRNGNYFYPQLENLILKLYAQLKNSKGKKQYGYLKPEVKKTVDEIVSRLAENPAVQKMYSEWCELEREKYFTYTSAVKKFPSLAENKVFKPIKNCVINTVLNMENIETLAVSQNQFKNSEKYNRSAVHNAAVSLLNFLGKMVADDYNKNTRSRYITEHKLQNAIRRKKLSLGIKDDRTVRQEVEIHQ